MKSHYFPNANTLQFCCLITGLVARAMTKFLAQWRCRGDPAPMRWAIHALNPVPAPISRLFFWVDRGLTPARNGAAGDHSL